MSTTAPRFKPGASRQWLQWLAIGFLCLIGTILLVRALTGTTLKEHKASVEAEKAASELASKPAGNAEGLSAKLERARLDAEKERDRESSQAPGTIASAPLSGPNATAQVPIVPAPSPSLASPRPGSAAMPNAGGQRQGEPSDEQLDAYAASKEQAMRDGNRKIAVWEAAPSPSLSEGARSQFGSVTSAAGPEDRAASGPASNGQAGLGVAANPTAAMAQAWLQSQQNQAGANNSSQEQFRRGAASRSNAAPLLPRGPVGAHAVIEGDSFLVAMRTAVSSDIAGDCRADVVEDVYDSLTQRTKLIPNGSRVICTYDSQVVQGQQRLLLAFTRLVFPNGYWISLGGMDAADRQGAIGAPADVNTRFWKIFGNSFLIAAITKAAEPKSGTSTVTINTGSATAGATAAGVLAETARKTLDRNLNIKPELRVKPGDVLRVVVNRDMLLDPSVTGVR